MAVCLRISGVHARSLKEHLFPGDGNEAVAFALCGRHRAGDAEVLLVQEILPIPHEECVREPNRITWRTTALEPILVRAASQRLGVVKFHSHPTGFPQFSATDDRSDQDLFPSIYGWVDDDGPHASVIVLPDGRMVGRSIDVQNRILPLARIMIVGDDIRVFDTAAPDRPPAHAERHAQLFGTATTSLLSTLVIGVVGCSGTGSVAVELLARLGVRRLILVDPDRVEEKNLNRILGSRMSDATARRPKVEVLARSIRAMEIGVDVVPLLMPLATPAAVKALAGCDVVFGCMDSHDGRRTLNRLASFYLLPYLDCGVGLEADGQGGIHQVCAASHYLQPGGSSVSSRRIIDPKRADAEAIARSDPEAYARLRAEKYIDGANEDRPAVVSVNALAASLAVNELLARLHPYRDDPNRGFASVRMSLSQMHLYADQETYDGSIRRAMGRGDLDPLLDMPELTARSVVTT
jgi:hypothetical protein